MHLHTYIVWQLICLWKNIYMYMYSYVHTFIYTHVHRGRHSYGSSFNRHLVGILLLLKFLKMWTCCRHQSLTHFSAGVQIVNKKRNFQSARLAAAYAFTDFLQMCAYFCVFCCVGTAHFSEMSAALAEGFRLATTKASSYPSATFQASQVCCCTQITKVFTFVHWNIISLMCGIVLFSLLLCCRLLCFCLLKTY